MENILIVSATVLEIRPLWQDLAEPEIGAITRLRNCDLLITGVGQLQTAFHLGRALERNRYDLVINVGIAGAFSESYPKCSLVQIVSEELADLGAEGEGQHLDLFQMNLLDRDAAPFSGGALQSAGPALKALAAVPKVRSVTVNRVLHTAQSIGDIERRYRADVVNMEGGAVFYACALSHIPAISIRTISDKVGKRDKAAWDIPGAVRVLCEKADEILKELGR